MNHGEEDPSISYYDSDEEPSVGGTLSWRLDPEESLSDWTIHVSSINNSGIVYKSLTYNVHKAVLAVGDRKCEYFVRLFQNEGNFRESEHMTSRIELEEKASEAFPVFLDYVYFGNLQISTENATALHYLGQYFGNRRLRWEAKQFWKKDLNIDNVAKYYGDAKVFCDEKIIEAVVDYCASNIRLINPMSPLLANTEPQFWLSVVERSSSKMDRLKKVYLSVLITKFCSLYEDLDLEMFLKLTDERLLSDIDPSVSIELMVLEKRIREKSNSRNLQKTEVDSDALVNLQKRCEGSLCGKWGEIDLCDDVDGALSKLDSVTLARLLQHVQSDLKKALVDAHNTNNLLSNAQAEIRLLQRENRTMKEEVRKAKREIVLLHHRLPRNDESLRRHQMGESNENASQQMHNIIRDLHIERNDS